MKVNVDGRCLLSILNARVAYWCEENSAFALPLFNDMYQTYISNGDFEIIRTVNVNSVVDNDIFNDCAIYRKGDYDFGDMMSLYKRYGSGRLLPSNEPDVMRIEAVSRRGDAILARYGYHWH